VLGNTSAAGLSPARYDKLSWRTHFLGIAYSPTRMVDNTSIAPVDDGAIVDPKPRSVNIKGGVFIIAKSITRRFTHSSASANKAPRT